MPIRGGPFDIKGGARLILPCQFIFFIVKKSNFIYFSNMVCHFIFLKQIESHLIFFTPRQLDMGTCISFPIYKTMPFIKQLQDAT